MVLKVKFKDCEVERKKEEGAKELTLLKGRSRERSYRVKQMS